MIMKEDLIDEKQLCLHEEPQCRDGKIRARATTTVYTLKLSPFRHRALMSKILIRRTFAYRSEYHSSGQDKHCRYIRHAKLC